MFFQELRVKSKGIPIGFFNPGIPLVFMNWLIAIVDIPFKTCLK